MNGPLMIMVQRRAKRELTVRDARWTSRSETGWNCAKKQAERFLDESRQWMEI
jgi:hypothetical protein